MKKKYTFIALFFLLIADAVFAQTTDIDWMRIDSGYGTAIARDAADNVYKTFSSTIIYLRKLDKYGNQLWQQSFTTDTIFNYENPWQVHVDSKQNVIVVGDRHTHSVESGNHINALVILKYSPTGKLLWQQIIDGSFSTLIHERYNNRITSLLDAHDNIYVGSGGNFAGMSPAFNAVKLNSSGTVLWEKVQTFDSNPNYIVQNIRNKGRLLALSGDGRFSDNNALLWVLDTSGNTIGTKEMAGFSGKDAAFDSANNVYFLANTAATGTNDITVYKFRNNGTLAWSKTYDFNGYEGGYNIVLSPDHNLVILGSGNQAPDNSLYTDWLTFKIDQDGKVLWSQRYDKTSHNDEYATDMAMDTAGNIFLTGKGGPFPGGSNLGATQWVTLKYAANGALRWSVALDTLSDDISGIALTLASDGSLFVLADVNSTIIHLIEFTGTGSCGIPTNVNAVNISADSAVIKWKAIAGAYLYHLEYKPASSPTWIKISTDKNTFTLKQLFPGTSYDYHVQAVCKTGLSAYSPIKQFSTLGMGYCNSRGLNSTDEWIDLVYFSDMLNSTGNDGGYRDYTNKVATVAAGAPYDLTLSAEFSNGNAFTEAWSVWIDWNKDGDFQDAGELVVRYKSQQIGWETHTFFIPSNASGLTKMRVAIQRSNYSNPCDTFQRGDVEDYSVNILPQSIIAIAKQDKHVSLHNAVTVLPNPANEYLIISAPALKDNAVLQVYNATGQLVLSRQAEKINQFKLDVSRLNKGVYILRITVNNGKTETVKWIKE
jgi:hypothetical protein